MVMYFSPHYRAGKHLLKLAINDVGDGDHENDAKRNSLRLSARTDEKDKK